MDQLADYYRDRAAEYDAIYLKHERQDDLARLHRLLPPLVTGRSVLEVAAGTGYWTKTLSTTAKSIVATDLNDETLQIARTRSYGPAEVSFLTADAYDLGVVPGSFDAIFTGFFWSHVLRADVQRFVRGLQNRLAPGGLVILADNRYVEGSNHPISRVGEDGDTYQTRRLADGREFEILKNFPTRAEFAADLASVTSDVRWTDLDYYWLAEVSLP